MHVTIVALGDSTTAGTPFYQSPLEAPPGGRGDERGQYAYWLVQMHPGWRVLNRGVNGQRTDQIAERFDRDVIAVRPHAVVIIAAVNDVYEGRSVEHVITHLHDMYERAEAAQIPVVAGSIPPYNTATADKNHKMRLINEWILKKAARSVNVTFVDTRRAVAAPDNADRLSGSPDGLHPDIDGYRRMAEAIEPALRLVLAASRN